MLDIQDRVQIRSNNTLFTHAFNGEIGVIQDVLQGAFTTYEVYIPAQTTYLRLLEDEMEKL